MKQKKRVNIGKILGVITDILIVPVVILSIFTSFVMINARRENELYSIFGYSVVKILSGSMVASGFDVGDLTLIKTLQDGEYRVGDDIAFYRFNDSGDPSKSGLVLIEDFKNLPEVTTNEKVTGSKTKADAKKAKSAIIFHRVIAVYMAEDGTRFYETKGTSNDSPDGQLTREDFVVGKNVDSKFLMDVLTFCASSSGMILLVIIPTSILIFFQLIEIFTILITISTEKKVLSLELDYKSQDSAELKVVESMADMDKIYFFDVVPNKEKKNVATLLWGGFTLSKASKKRLNFYKNIKKSLKLYSVSRNDYWKFWVSYYKNSKRIIKRRIRADSLVSIREMNKLNHSKKPQNLNAYTKRLDQVKKIKLKNNKGVVLKKI